MTECDQKMICSFCDEPLSAEEREAPRMDGDEPVCDECWSYNFTFDCCACGQEENDNLQHWYLVVTKPVCSLGGADVEPGIYYIKGGPYHGGSILGPGHFYPDQLLRLRDLPPRVSTGRYDCGHLCRDCVARYRLPTTTAYRDACKNAIS